MSQFFTRSGDDGTTGLLGAGRVAKDHPRMEALGALDEASAALGLARASLKSTDSQSMVLAIQRQLYSIMAEIAATQENAARFRVISAEHVTWLEMQIDIISNQTQVPSEFIVPGDSPAGAALALARTIVRRAERRLATLWQQKQLENGELLRYLNRLSSLCYILELFENQLAGKTSPTLAKDTE